MEIKRKLISSCFTKPTALLGIFLRLCKDNEWDSSKSNEQQIPIISVTEFSKSLKGIFAVIS
jgi:hypothetical protein